MKMILIVILMLTLNLFGAEVTNGVFYVDKSVECHLVAVNGVTTTNKLVSGKTCMVSNVLFEVPVTYKTGFYFSGGILVEADAQSIITINLFDQDVKNLDIESHKAEFGAYNLSISIQSGKVVIICPPNPNSSLIINTPIATYELDSGKFLFDIGTQNLVYVMDGEMKIHGDKNRVDSAKKGKRVAVGTIADSVATTMRNIKDTESSSILKLIESVESKKDDVKFYIVEGKVVGIWMK